MKNETFYDFSFSPYELAALCYLSGSKEVVTKKIPDVIRFEVLGGVMYAISSASTNSKSSIDCLTVLKLNSEDDLSAIEGISFNVRRSTIEEHLSGPANEINYSILVTESTLEPTVCFRRHNTKRGQVTVKKMPLRKQSAIPNNWHSVLPEAVFEQKAAQYPAKTLEMIEIAFSMIASEAVKCYDIDQERSTPLVVSRGAKPGVVLYGTSSMFSMISPFVMFDFDINKLPGLSSASQIKTSVNNKISKPLQKTEGEVLSWNW